MRINPVNIPYRLCRFRRGDVVEAKSHVLLQLTRPVRRWQQLLSVRYPSSIGPIPARWHSTASPTTPSPLRHLPRSVVLLQRPQIVERSRVVLRTLEGAGQNWQPASHRQGEPSSVTERYDRRHQTDGRWHRGWGGSPQQTAASVFRVAEEKGHKLHHWEVARTNRKRHICCELLWFLIKYVFT